MPRTPGESAPFSPIRAPALLMHNSSPGWIEAQWEPVSNVQLCRKARNNTTTGVHVKPRQWPGGFIHSAAISEFSDRCDVVVMGGGHAGCEAAAAARELAPALYLDLQACHDRRCSCNPAIAGWATWERHIRERKRRLLLESFAQTRKGEAERTRRDSAERRTSRCLSSVRI